MKIKILLAIFIVCAFHGIIKDSTEEFSCLQIKYPKLKYEWYTTIYIECNSYKDYKISPSDICAIIQSESEFDDRAVHYNYRDNEIVSTDHSLMQVNSCFGIYDDPFENLKKGIYEYHLCLAKTKGDKKNANRLYNAGRNNKPENYKNWAYVKAIDKNRNAYVTLSNKMYEVR